MASWTDGAAYAPIERPAGFATPEVALLEVAAPEAAQTPGPMPTPTGFQPTAPAMPLDQVRTAPPPSRNPSAPFEVGAGLMTVGSSMGRGAERDPRVPFQTYEITGNPPSGVDTLPPPTGAPLPAPVISVQQQSSQRTLVFLAVVCAVLGLTIPAVAPWMLFVAGLLTLRALPLVGRASVWSIAVGLFLLVFGVFLAPDAASALGRLAAAVFAAWFGIAASRRSRPRR